MKKSIVIITAVCVLFFVVGVVFFKLATVESGLHFTEDIEDYNKYPIPLNVFPEGVPSNAHVVAFSYYEYWNEAEDIYLELKFDSLTEMESYLSSAKSSCLQKCQRYTPPLNGEWFIEEQSIYDESYTELFCAFYWTSHNDVTYTGYTIENDSKGAIFRCNFGLICYSFDELTVIHTLVSGYYQDSVHNYSPAYFKRFNVPLDQKHDRTIFLEW